MPRGGRRTGKPGASYSNRSDLNQTRTLPATAVPGQPYGQAGAQLAAQAALPMASAPTELAPEAPQGPGPGELPPLTGASERPNEPITHGLGVGPGAGPEVFPSAPDPVLKGLAILNSLPHLPAGLQALKDSLAVSQMNGTGPSDYA